MLHAPCNNGEAAADSQGHRRAPYADSWQLVVNTGTTIVTLPVVFLIQRSQNKDSVALIRLARQDGTVTKSHSIEEAERRHRSKHGRGRDAA